MITTEKHRHAASLARQLMNDDLRAELISVIEDLPWGQAGAYFVSVRSAISGGAEYRTLYRNSRVIAQVTLDYRRGPRLWIPSSEEGEALYQEEKNNKRYATKRHTAWSWAVGRFLERQGCLPKGWRFEPGQRGGTLRCKKRVVSLNSVLRHANRAGSPGGRRPRLEHRA